MSILRTRLLAHVGGREVEVPVWSVRSGRPGPVVAITGGMHGDELTGVAVVHALLETLRQEPPAGGEVHLYPTLNPVGLTEGCRTVGEAGFDLNRMFPASVEEDLPGVLWREMSSRRLDLLVDVHADSALSVPYVLLDRPVALSGRARWEMSERMRGFAEATGLFVLSDYPEEHYLRFGLDRSLTGSMVNALHVPALTIEAGPRGRVDPVVVLEVVRALEDLLRVVVESEDEACRRESPRPRGWRRALGPRAGQEGVLVPLARPGEPHPAGGVLGEIRGPDGSVLQRIVAAEESVVVSWADVGWIGAGSVVATLGLRDEESW